MPFRSDRRRPPARGDRPPEGAAAEGLALLARPAAGPAGPRLAAAAARARAAVPAADAEARAVRDVAAGIAGPILTSYVLWLLLDARGRGLERLYFLSRDGQVLKELADILAPRLGVEVERRYLQASRQAWNRALGTRHADRWLWNDTAEASALDILRRLAVPAEAAAAELARLGVADPAAPLDAHAAGRMRRWLASDGFAAVAAAAAAESRALLEAYLAQEGLFDAAPFALVDLGWTGSQHQTLCDLRAARGLGPPGCYLFGAKGRGAPWGSLRRGFYFDEGRDGDDSDGGDGRAAPDALPPRDLYALMETFCTAAEGTLTGFARTPRGVAPVCAPDRTPELEAWGLSTLRATLRATARGLEPERLGRGDLAALRGTIGRLLEAFWRRPSPAEARAWGGFPWDAGQGHEPAVFPLAHPYTLADLQTAARAPGRLRKREIFWVEGALAMTPPPVAATLRGLADLRARLGRLRRAARATLAGGGSWLTALPLLPL